MQGPLGGADFSWTLFNWKRKTASSSTSEVRGSSVGTVVGGWEGVWEKCGGWEAWDAWGWRGARLREYAMTPVQLYAMHLVVHCCSTPSGTPDRGAPSPFLAVPLSWLQPPSLLICESPTSPSLPPAPPWRPLPFSCRPPFLASTPLTPRLRIPNLPLIAPPSGTPDHGPPLFLPSPLPGFNPLPSSSVNPQPPPHCAPPSPSP